MVHPAGHRALNARVAIVLHTGGPSRGPHHCWTARRSVLSLPGVHALGFCRCYRTWRPARHGVAATRIPVCSLSRPVRLPGHSRHFHQLVAATLTTPEPATGPPTSVVPRPLTPR